MSRMPTNLSLDFRGMIAANRVAAKRLHEMIEQYGIDAVLSVIDSAIELSEQAVRKRLRELPDGVYRSQKYLDHDGTANLLFRVHVEMTKKGDSLILDFSKSADQSRRFMNSTESGMLAGIRAALLPILAYDVPWNEGVFNPMKVIAREGSIVSAKFPAPVSQGPLGAMWLVEMVVTEALSLMMATNRNTIVEAQAAPNGGPDGFSVHGINQHGEQTHGSFLDQIYVGGGAYFDHDGLSPQGHRHIPAIRLQNVERNEFARAGLVHLSQIHSGHRRTRPASRRHLGWARLRAAPLRTDADPLCLSLLRVADLHRHVRRLSCRLQHAADAEECLGPEVDRGRPHSL